MNSPSKTFYVVRNKEGKFLRSKGYNGYGECWVDGLDKAKVWSKPGPAKAQRTWWLEHFPDYGAPDVIPLLASIGDPLPLAKGDIKKAQKGLSSIRKEKYALEKTLHLLHEDMGAIKDQSLRGHAQSGINTYKRMLDKVLEREKKQLLLLQVLTRESEPLALNSTPSVVN